MNQIQQLLLWAIGSLAIPADHHRITRETFRAAYPTQSDKDRIAAAQAKRERKNAKRLKNTFAKSGQIGVLVPYGGAHLQSNRY